MDTLPTKRQQDSAKIVDPEIVGHEPQPPFWHKLVSRLVFCIILGGVGFVAIMLGTILTITIVGAAVGMPMLFMGLIFVVFAVVIGVGSGRVITVRGRHDEDCGSDSRDGIG
jgi:hypothetical protein